MQDAVDTVRSERALERTNARIDAVLAVLAREPQTVQEGIYAGLKASLGKQYAKASKQRLEARPPSAHAMAEAVFKTRAA